MTDTFISPEIKSYIETYMIVKNTYEYGQITITIHKVEENYEQDISICQTVLHIINMVTDYYKIDDNTEISITYYMTHFKKYFPINLGKGTEAITKNNINTGMTDGKHGAIVIWRVEEFEKVLIHELLHFYDIENTLILNILGQDLVKSAPFLGVPNELATELQTWFLYLVYNPKCIIEDEIIHSIDNAYHIINYYYTGKFPMLINTNTSTLYYYIYKGVFFNSINTQPLSVLINCSQTIPVTINLQEFIDTGIKLGKINDGVVSSRHITMMKQI